MFWVKKKEERKKLSKCLIFSSVFCIGTSFNAPKIALLKGEKEQSSPLDSSSVLGALLGRLHRLMHAKRMESTTAKCLCFVSLEVERVKIKSRLMCVLSAEDARASHFKAKLEPDERERQGALSCDERLLDRPQPGR